MKNLKKTIIILLLFAFSITTSSSSVYGEEAEARAEAESTTVSIIMYHRVSGNSSLWGKLCITPEEFESDLKYLKENNYNIVTMHDLISYVYYGEKLPKKPIVLTFDDGNYSDYRFVYPLLKQYNAKAVFSIIGCVTDQYSEENRDDIHYPHLTWDQIEEMMDSGVMEVQNHGYNLHNCDGSAQGAKRYRNESKEEYFNRLKEDVMKLQNRAIEKVNVAPDTFTYPFGAYSPESDEAMSEAGFYATLICEERNNTLTVGDTDCLYGLGRVVRPHNAESGTFFKDVEVMHS